jgi:DegV family protein with EDD domain
VSVVVVTDSSAVAPPGWIEGLPLHVVPLEIAWSDGTLEPGDTPYAAVSGRLSSAPIPPKTGSPSPGSYRELMADLLTTHDGVLVVCPATELSTTFTSATLGARQLADPRVRVLDGRTAASGQGLVSVEAARAARDGADLESVCGRALDVAARVQIWATLAQLEFLRRSGRLPAIAAIGAGALRLQPVVRYAGSSPTPVGVTRSGRRATDRLYRAWERSIVEGGTLHAVAFHSARKQDADDLVRRIAARGPEGESAVAEVTASLASHTGPGLLGLAWFWDN